MKVLLWGSGGFLGRNVADELERQGHDWAPVLRGTVAPGGEWAAVINCAAHPYDSGQFASTQEDILWQNVEITREVYRFCAASGITEVRACGSWAIYTMYSQEGGYALSKLFAEQAGAYYHDAFGINTVTYRLTNPYGPYDSLDENRAHVIPALILRALRTDGPLEVRGTSKRQFVYAGDVARAMVASLAVKGNHAALDYSHPAEYTIGYVADSILEALGQRRDIVIHDQDSLERPLVGGDAPTDLEDGLRQTVAWYREQTKGDSHDGVTIGTIGPTTASNSRADGNCKQDDQLLL